jgi:sugar phosphate permease
LAIESVVRPVARRWGKRHAVFAIILLVNMTIWLDEGVFGALTPFWAKEFGLSTSQIGVASAAYLLSYFPMLFAAGVLSDRFGAKTILLIAVAGCSLLSASMLFVNNYHELILRNLVFGFFFGLLWAPCNRFISLWLPSQERAQYAAIWICSTLLSFVVAAPLGLMLASGSGWRIGFLFAGLVGVPTFLFLLFGTAERPELMTSVTAAELAHIYKGKPVKTINNERFRWRDLGASLRQWSVLWMILATALATTPTWLILTWGTYGLIEGFKLDSARASVVSSAFILVPIAYGFFNGWVVNKVFGGRCRPALATGAVLSAVGFLGVWWFAPGYWVWAFLIFGLGFIVDPFFWGTINPYWAGLTKPEYQGTLSGVSAACQVAVGYALVSLSGSWVKSAIAGPRALDHIWLIGGLIFLLSTIPIFLAREVRTA